MRARVSPILYLGFGSLVLLVAMAGLAAARRASQIYAEMRDIYETHRQVNSVLNEIGSALNVSGILVRDYLLDQSHLTAELHRKELVRIRTEMGGNLDRLHKLVPEENAETLASLRRELDAYWDALDPLFDWSPRQKIALSGFFLKQTVLPRRDAALAIAREIARFNDMNFAVQQRRIAESQAGFRRHLVWMLSITISLGILVAAFSIGRITRLERRNQEHQARTERAEQELRRLSQDLVRAQESERKAISRELHDAVGQTLTALRMELSQLPTLREAPEEEFKARVEEARQLAEQTLATVRSLAMGLRPAMLDDLGLAPALEWQSRDFSRRSGIPVELQLDGDLDGLPEAHRTAVFRIAQEALTNCARHARAKRVRIAVHGRKDAVSLSIQDDGVGMDVESAAREGMGLLGIEERARELGGAVSIYSRPGKGMTLQAEIPLPKEALR